MIDPKIFYDTLIENDIKFFTGVPDSLLKNICAYITEKSSDLDNVIAANEGNALAMGVGHYLSTGRPALVYMQNSGLGNIINPLASLTDKSVYKIPALLLIGLRGEEGVSDEPQHKKQGEVTLEILTSMGIKYYLINKDTNDEDVKLVINDAIEEMKINKQPVAIVASKGTFNTYKLQSEKKPKLTLTREESIKSLIDNIKEDYVVVSTTGKASRELFELRQIKDGQHDKDFICVGSMGHVSSIGLGIARNTDKKVYILDGDGAFIMHMGASAIIGQSDVNNIRHIVINNGSHESVGGQLTVGLNIDILKIADACGYDKVFSIDNKKQLIEIIDEIEDFDGKVFIEIKVLEGSRDDLGRPTSSPEEIKKGFMSNFI